MRTCRGCKHTKLFVATLGKKYTERRVRLPEDTFPEQVEIAGKAVAYIVQPDGGDFEPVGTELRLLEAGKSKSLFSSATYKAGGHALQGLSSDGRAIYLIARGVSGGDSVLRYSRSRRVLEAASADIELANAVFDGNRFVASEVVSVDLRKLDPNCCPFGTAYLAYSYAIHPVSYPQSWQAIVPGGRFPTY